MKLVAHDSKFYIVKIVMFSTSLCFFGSILFRLYSVPEVDVRQAEYCDLTHL